MEYKEHDNLSIYRLCPDCKEDILKHKGVADTISVHGEQIKREIENYRRSYPEELFKNHILSEIEKFIKKVVEMERKIDSPLFKMNKNAYILLESWRNIIDIYKSELAPPLPKRSKITDNNQKLSYTWLSNPDTELLELYQLLKANKLIHPDTTEEQLKAVFTAKPFNTIRPINWIGAKNLLAYFLDSIYPNKIHFNTNQWSVAEKCFTDGKNLAQIKDKYLANISKEHRGKPKNYQIIDEVLKGL